jgi:hypothetical protein
VYVEAHSLVYLEKSLLGWWAELAERIGEEEAVEGFLDRPQLFETRYRRL